METKTKEAHLRNNIHLSVLTLFLAKRIAVMTWLPPSACFGYRSEHFRNLFEKKEVY